MLVRTRDGASRALALYQGPDLKVNARWGNLEYDPGADLDLCFGKTGCFTGICEDRRPGLPVEEICQVSFLR